MQLKIWDERSHHCYIYEDEEVAFIRETFSHILPKGHYDKWRDNPDNIVLMTRKAHFEWHNIPRSTLIQSKGKVGENWRELFQRYDDMKAEYNRLFR